MLKKSLALSLLVLGASGQDLIPGSRLAMPQKLPQYPGVAGPGRAGVDIDGLNKEVNILNVAWKEYEQAYNAALEYREVRNRMKKEIKDLSLRTEPLMADDDEFKNIVSALTEKRKDLIKQKKELKGKLKSLKSAQKKYFEQQERVEAFQRGDLVHRNREESFGFTGIEPEQLGKSLGSSISSNASSLGYGSQYTDPASPLSVHSSGLSGWRSDVTEVAPAPGLPSVDGRQRGFATQAEIRAQRHAEAEARRRDQEDAAERYSQALIREMAENQGRAENNRLQQRKSVPKARNTNNSSGLRQTSPFGAPVGLGSRSNSRFHARQTAAVKGVPGAQRLGFATGSWR